jgi:hypothetical protein
MRSTGTSHAAARTQDSRTDRWERLMKPSIRARAINEPQRTVALSSGQRPCHSHRARYEVGNSDAAHECDEDACSSAPSTTLPLQHSLDDRPHADPRGSRPIYPDHGRLLSEPRTALALNDVQRRCAICPNEKSISRATILPRPTSAEGSAVRNAFDGSRSGEARGRYVVAGSGYVRGFACLDARKSVAWCEISELVA